jgi:hypothetical protein
MVDHRKLDLTRSGGLEAPPAVAFPAHPSGGEAKAMLEHRRASSTPRMGRKNDLSDSIST